MSSESIAGHARTSDHRPQRRTRPIPFRHPHPPILIYLRCRLQMPVRQEATFQWLHFDKGLSVAATFANRNKNSMFERRLDVPAASEPVASSHSSKSSVTQLPER
jgi:hypothetical protein